MDTNSVQRTTNLFLHWLFLLRQDQLNVARGGHVSCKRWLNMLRRNMRNIHTVAKQNKWNKLQLQIKLTVDASMSTVGPATLLLSLVYLNVRHIQGIDIKTFDLPHGNSQLANNISNQR